MSSQPSHSERIERGMFERVTVLDENEEEVEVFNWVNLQAFAVVRGHNPIVEKFDDMAKIGAGDSSATPEAVTQRLAYNLRDEFGIDVEDHDIRVIDPTDEEVDVV